MTKTEKYLIALQGQGGSTAPASVNDWPAAIKRRPIAFEHPLDCQFLDDRCIGHYLASLQPPTPIEKVKAAGRANGHTHSFRPVFSGFGRDWKATEHPLPLCEFLAYKCGLSYRSAADIRRDLLGLDSRGQRYSRGVEQYAFFDSSPRYGDTQAFAFIHHRTGYVIFRGGSSFGDFMTNFRDELTDRTYPVLDTVPQTLVGTPRPGRHTGFAIAWGSIAPDIEAWVTDQVKHNRMDSVVLSGHGQGGALAVLGGYQFARRHLCPIEAVITFGAPLVGGADFKSDYESPGLGLKDRTLHVQSAEDLGAAASSSDDELQQVGHIWHFSKRPLRPIWQMALLSPLIDTEVASRKKIERLQDKSGSRARRQAGRHSPGRRRRSAETSNAPLPQRSWFQNITEIVYALIGYIAGIIIRAFAARSVERRYGLYLSTLAYRKIRAHHLERARLVMLTRRSQENERIIIEKAFRDANADLALHLGVARGRHPRTFRHIKHFPIRVETPAALVALEKRFVNYVA